MAQFEVIIVDESHDVSWVAHQWEEGLSIATLRKRGLLSELPVSVDTEIVPDHYIIQANDRVECTQPLSKDPKMARRERLMGQVFGTGAVMLEKVVHESKE